MFENNGQSLGQPRHVAPENIHGYKHYKEVYFCYFILFFFEGGGGGGVCIFFKICTFQVHAPNTLCNFAVVYLIQLVLERNLGGCL